MRTTLCLFALVALALALPLACKPAQPTVTARSAEVREVTASGLALRTELLAHNPNRYDIRVNDVSGRVTVGSQDLGVRRLSEGIDLPANREVTITSTFVAPWTDLPGLLSATVSNAQVPFRIEGQVNATVRGITMTIPFQLVGSFPRDRLVQSAVPGILNGIPEIPSLPVPALPAFPTAMITSVEADAGLRVSDGGR